MDLGVQGHDAMAEDRPEPGELGNIDHRDATGCDLFGGAATRQHLPSGGCKAFGEVGDPRLVVHGQQRGGHGGESTVRLVDKLKALKVNDWLVVAGGVLVLVFGVARWFSWEVTVDQVVEAKDTTNAFDYLLTGVLPWLLIVGAAAVTVLLATEALRPGNVPWPLVMVGVTLLGFVLIVIRLILGHDLETGEGADLDQSRGIGIWMSALGALMAFVGAFIGFRNTGLETEYKPVAGGLPPEREIPPPGDVPTP